jgi:hypothetical protein
MDMITAQQEVAAIVAAANPYDEWERIVADIEIEQRGADYRTSMVSFVIARKPDSSLHTVDIKLSDATRKAVIAMYRERLDNAGDKIGSFGLEIDRDGKYRFEISYDKPDRINANWDSKRQTKINNYLQTYRPTP